MEKYLGVLEQHHDILCKLIQEGRGAYLWELFSSREKLDTRLLIMYIETLGYNNVVLESYEQETFPESVYVSWLGQEQVALCSTITVRFRTATLSVTLKLNDKTGMVLEEHHVRIDGWDASSNPYTWGVDIGQQDSKSVYRRQRSLEAINTLLDRERRVGFEATERRIRSPPDQKTGQIHGCNAIRVEIDCAPTKEFLEKLRESRETLSELGLEARGYHPAAHYSGK